MSNFAGADVPVRAPDEVTGVTTDRLFRVLASERCRTIFLVLDQHGTAVPKSVLARQVAKEKLGTATEADVEDVRVTLDHHHLPALEAVGLIRQTGDDEVDLVPSSPIWTNQTFKSYIETNVIPATDVSKALLALSDERRREALDVLQRNEQVTMKELATQLEHSGSGLDDSVSDVERSGVLIELLHVHIPKLTDFGIVETDGQQVRYTGDPLLDEWWFDASSTTGPGGV